jgi:recombination protein RecA
MVELYGPEGAGKTWILSKAYAKALDSGMKVLHYDAEGTYNKIFAAMNGVDVSKLHYSDNDRCEEILSEIEQLCLNNEYDIIGIDSLAALVPQKMADDDLGKNNYSPLANAISRCLPRVSSAIKRSKTVVFFVNQLRDNVGELYGDPEKTPGGRSLKFYATYRLDVRRRSSKKEEFPHMYNSDGRQIGHRLCVKTKKNKVFPPGLECLVDLMYQKPSRIFDIISNAISTDVIQRQRTKTGELRGKKLTYRNLDFVPGSKFSAGEVFFWLKENGLVCNLLSDMGVDDFEEFLISEDISDEDVEKYMIETI